MIREIYNLTASQKDAVSYALRNDETAIKGKAGSGKTLVAISLANELINNNIELLPEENLPTYVVTFTNALVNYTNLQFKNENIKVRTVYKMLLNFLKENGENITLDYTKRVKFFSDELDTERYNNDFMADEFDFIYGKGLLSRESYLKARRTGRGRGRIDRNYIFDLFEKYQSFLEEQNLVDSKNLGNVVLEFCEKKEFRPIAYHLIIDEVQDLPVTIIRALQKTVSKKKIYIGDTAQSIYGSGFTWTESIGKQLKPFDLKTNFRNTQEIYEAADSILKFEYDINPTKANEMSASDESILRRSGTRPQMFFLKDENSAYMNILMKLLELVNESNDKTICIGYRNRKYSDNILSKLKQTLRKRNIYYEDLHKNRPSYKPLDSRVKISTFHSMKGLEYDHVLAIDLEDKIFFEDNEEPSDEIIDVERRLLFVAMTRAKYSLSLFTYSDKPLRFLSELSPMKILPIVWNPDSYNDIYKQQINRLNETRELIYSENIKQDEKVSDLEEKLENLKKELNQEKYNAEFQAIEKDEEIKLLEIELNEEKEKRLRTAKKLKEYNEETKNTNILLGHSKNNYFFKKDAKIVMLGGNHGIKKKDIDEIFKKLGLPANSYLHVPYDEITNHDIGKYTNSYIYSDIFIGATPHMAKNIGDSSSVLRYLLKNKEAFPKITIFENEVGSLLQFTKSNLEKNILNSDLYASLHGV